MRYTYNRRSQVLATTMLTGSILALGLLGTPARAQTAATTAAAQSNDSTIGEVVVTGSRIRRGADTATDAPVSVISQQDILVRGAVNVGDIITHDTSITSPTSIQAGHGGQAGSGQQFPNLFNLGPGRTLSLVNGRRMPPSSSMSPSNASLGDRVGDRVLDTNLIPVGLVDRIDIVQAGGAAVYGSDAIAGVINYVLKQNFQGLTVDVQYGNSTYSDYEKPSIRITGGSNFDHDRGNIAFDVEWSKTPPLYYGNRPITNPPYVTATNPLNKTTTDGIPATTPVYDPRFWVANTNGVISPTAGPNPNALPAFQFAPDGASVIPFNPGARYVPGFPCAVPFCSGGDGYPYGQLAAYLTGVETNTYNVMGHYDLTPHMKVSTELLYGRTKGDDPLGSGVQTRWTIGSGAASGPIAFTKANAFLTPAAIASLSAISPAFANGGTLYLSKVFDDLLPSRAVIYNTDTYRGVVSLDGDFDFANRNFYYNTFYSRAMVRGETNSYGFYTAHLANALNAVTNSAGQIVCQINQVTVTDQNCVPLNPFGVGNITPAARAYSTVKTGSIYTNTMDDFLASIGSDLFSAPAGPVKFNASYEHRHETSKNEPSTANMLGLTGTGVVTTPTSGKFSTNELAAEILAPILGRDFTLPLVEALDVSGQYRYVDNSVAGRESVWGVSGNWTVGYGLKLRASISRNFRAPTLTQLFAPQVARLASGTLDPCDPRAINTGPSPATRLANCQALFAKNPQWGPLSAFQDPAYNFTTNLVTTGGNPDLKNEISKTKTFGFIWRPKYVPGELTVVADRIQIDLQNGLTAFTATNFVQGCFDAPDMPADLCSTFTRDPRTGYLVTGISTTFNAARVEYRGEVYNVNYSFPVSWVLPMFDDPGNLELSTQATHNESLKTVVAGVATQQAGTTVSPRWVVRSDVRWRRGPLQINYEMYYLPDTKINVFDTIETTPFPNIKANIQHSISALYDFKQYQFRVGVNNFTNELPPFQAFNYGDPVGRQWFIGVKAHY